MANATEEDFDLHVAGSGIAARNDGGGQWRGFAGGRISFGLVDGSQWCPFFCVGAGNSVFFAALDLSPMH